MSSAHPAVLAILLTVLAGLPPHPLNSAIGGRSGNSKPRRSDAVVQAILDSREFSRMVESAVRFAEDSRLDDDRELGSLPAAARVRVILAELFGDIEAVDQWRERLGDPPGGGGFDPMGPAEVLAPHPLDDALGGQVSDGRAVARRLRGSRELRQILSQAAREAEPLRAMAGLNYAEQVRLRIKELLRVAEGGDSGNRPTPQDDDGAPPPPAPPP